MNIRILSLIIVGVALILAPFLIKGYLIFQATTILIYAIAIIGLNILTGINGQISLGHGAFFAMGAYLMAITLNVWELPFYMGFPIAALACFLFGFLFGLPALRLEGVYLALATFTLAVAVPPVLKLSFLEPVTGGVMGMLVPAPSAPFGLPLAQDQWMYLLTLAFLLIMYGMAQALKSSRSGRAMMAIRDNPIAARAMGINIALYKTLAFGLSAFYAGIAGCLSALVVQFISADSFTFFLSVYLIVGLVVGGVAWFPGALIGGAYIVLVPNLVETFSPPLAGSFYGLLLMIIMLIMPKGASGLIELFFPNRPSASDTPRPALREGAGDDQVTIGAPTR
jgi:branched-chain amino acid transport system permease protein